MVITRSTTGPSGPSNQDKEEAVVASHTKRKEFQQRQEEVRNKRGCSDAIVLDENNTNATWQKDEYYAQLYASFTQQQERRSNSSIFSSSDGRETGTTSTSSSSSSSESQTRTASGNTTRYVSVSCNQDTHLHDHHVEGKTSMYRQTAPAAPHHPPLSVVQMEKKRKSNNTLLTECNTKQYGITTPFTECNNASTSFTGCSYDGGSRTSFAGCTDHSPLSTETTRVINSIIAINNGDVKEEDNAAVRGIVKKCFREKIWPDVKFLTDSMVRGMKYEDGPNFKFRNSILGKLLNVTRKEHYGLTDKYRCWALWSGIGQSELNTKKSNVTKQIKDEIISGELRSLHCCHILYSIFYNNLKSIYFLF